jgi:hypothetical protein
MARYINLHISCTVVICPDEIIPEGIMKRLAFGSCIVLFLAVSCATIKDRGVYNPHGISEPDFAALTIDKYLSVSKIDEEKVSWNSGAFYAPQTVRLAPGVHVFQIDYADGSLKSTKPQTVIGNFERNGTYIIRSQVSRNFFNMAFLNIDIYEIQNGEEIKVTFDPLKLQGGDDGVIPAYIKYILNPTMEETGNTVKLENKDLILVFLPDMSYAMTDKKTGTETTGMVAFNMTIAMKDAAVYLLETGQKMEKEAFLNSQYQETAQIILSPVKCDAKNVAYTYVKPEELKGKEVTFSITEIAKE